MNLRRGLASALIVLAVPLVTSCGTNFGAAEEKVYQPADGTNDRSGAVDVLNALVVSKTDGSGTFIATLVNNNETRADQLTRVGSATGAATLTVTPGGSTRVPAGGLLDLAQKGRIFVRGDAVKAGYVVTMTVSFAHARSLTMNVPVVSADSSIYQGVPLPSGS